MYVLLVDLYILVFINIAILVEFFFQSKVGEYNQYNQYKCQMPNTINTINVRSIPPLHQYRPPGRGFSPEPSQQTPKRESDRHRC